MKNPVRTASVAAGILLLTVGCARRLYDPAQATRPYPEHLHVPESVDIQVFREGTDIELVNATAHSYREFDLWINRRFVAHLDALAAGESRRLSLWRFRDARGEQLNAGGFWRTEKPMPVRLVEIQTAPDQPLVGLVTIRAEEVEE